jgi:UDP-N-acetylmuramoylalanine--D-glutamate ligase
MDQYLDDKAQIFIYQNAGDSIIIEESIENVVEKYHDHIESTVVLSSPATLDNEHLQSIKANSALLGEHNIRNAACAVNALESIGVERLTIGDGLRQYNGMPGRLEYLGSIDTVAIFNDTNATTGDAVFASVDALQLKYKNIFLIAGGADKNLPIDKFLSATRKTNQTYLLDGTGTDKVTSKIGATIYSDLEDAVRDAVQVAKEEENSCIVFSPGFASFGMFKNEYDRGERFNTIINNYKNKKL